MREYSWDGERFDFSLAGSIRSLKWYIYEYNFFFKVKDLILLTLVKLVWVAQPFT